MFLKRAGAIVLTLILCLAAGFAQAETGSKQNSQTKGQKIIAAQKARGKKAKLSFDSFDGGGPDFNIVLNSKIVSYKCQKKYKDANHEELDGAGYTVTYTFTGLKKGKTTMTIEERSPIGENVDMIYTVTVDKRLNVSLKLTETRSLDEQSMAPIPILVMAVNDHFYCPTMMDHSSAEAFIEKLSAGAIEVEMHDYGNFEKVGTLPWSLPRNDEKITTRPGDLILYQGNQITIYYDQNTWNFTRLGRIDGVSREELLEVLGEGDVTVRFWVDWTE